MKLFVAATMNEAMSQVKAELGRDAIILHTRRFRKGGFLGFFGKELIEVMAAVDPQPSTPAIPLAPIVEKRPVLPAAASLAAAAKEEGTTVAAMQLELANMRKMIEQVLHKLPQQQNNQSQWLEMLIQNDIEPQIAQNLVKGLPEDSSLVAGNPGMVRQLLCDRISSYLQRVEGIHISAHSRKVVALVGPTGVGKTTTIAKLAANFAIKEGYKVALITADTYRIAAVEQLKTYADIIGVPIDIVYSTEEMKAALYRHRDRQLILIDTAGRSPRNSYQLDELKAMLTVDPYIETHLVLSCTTKYKEALEIVKNFSVCSPQKFLFTKIDEAANLGTVFNLIYQFPTTLSYVTNGQNVPDDIELASPTKIANRILRD